MTSLLLPISSQKAGKEENVTYDTNTHEVTVEVADNGQGQIGSNYH